MIRKILTPRKKHFAVYGFKILYEISKGNYEISHKILNPYNAKYTVHLLLFLCLI